MTEIDCVFVLVCEECEHELMTLTGRRHRQSLKKKKRRKDVGVFSVVATAASDSAVKVVPFSSAVLAPLPFFHSFSPDRP